MENIEEDEPAKITLLQSVDHGGNLVLALTGELDLSNVDGLRPAFEAATAKHPECLVIEVGDLNFMDSSGIALLVETAQQVETLQLRNPSQLIRRVLKATGVSEIVRFAP